MNPTKECAVIIDQNTAGLGNFPAAWTKLSLYISLFIADSDNYLCLHEHIECFLIVSLLLCFFLFLFCFVFVFSVVVCFVFLFFVFDQRQTNVGLLS